MFLRVRGMGASPENSQAAVMHVRGFRLSHSPPPMGFYSCAYASEVDGADAAETKARNCSISSERISKLTHSVVSIQRSPFCFSHFGVGIHAPSILESQRNFDAWLAHQHSRSDEGAWKGSTGDGSVVIWKETWNVYDILYDDARLLPDSSQNINECLSRLKAAWPGPKRADVIDWVTTLQADEAYFTRVMDGFVLLGDRVGRQKAVVCTHYYAEKPLSTDVFSEPSNIANGAASLGSVRSSASSSVALPPQHASTLHESYAPVIVCDLTLLDKTCCGAKLAAEVAWLLAYTTGLAENVLMRSCMVIIRLPYEKVPSRDVLTSIMEALASSTELSAVRAFAQMMRDAMDFIGEHVALAHRGIVAGRDEPASAAVVTSSVSSSPAVMFIGAEEDVLYASVHDALRSTHCTTRLQPNVDDGSKVCKDHNTDGAAHDDQSAVLSSTGSIAAGSVVAGRSVPGLHDSKAACSGEASKGGGAKLARVVYLIGDHAKYSAQDVTCRKDAEERFAALCDATVQFLEVPLKLLIEGDEEAWDAYTQRENARLNYCPCCAHCSHDHV